jgi:uncharacterized protein YbjT (DUF2867 family)
MKTAIIAGATGLVGGHLLEQVLEDPYFDKVIIFVRRSTGIDHPKLTEHIVNFDMPGEWKEKVKGDILFSAMGTTLKQAGSKEAQRRVDYTYQYEMARMAADNGVKDYVLVSTPGASPGSMVFYTRIRGELDRDVKKLSFDRIILLKPSVLDGKREEKRRGEEIGIKLGNILKGIPGLKKYRPIHGKIVARAMIGAVKKEEDVAFREYVLDELFEL